MTIISYDWDDNILEHDDAIDTYNIDLSQNSWGYDVSSSLDNCDLYGDYDFDAPDYDDIVRGGLGKRVAIIFAAGNERNDGDCGIDARGGYSCLGPPATAKNIIAVGAINSNDDSMTGLSSWGPVDDGRTKPDLVAPGCQTGGDAGITSTIPDDTYGVMCGTSMAAPVVSGICSLMIQKFQDLNEADLLPSTIKAVLVNTAEDLGNTGPDYSYGFGKVNAKAAADAVIAGSYDEGEFDGPNGIETYTFSVPSDTPKLQITLAWDDFPGAVNADPALVNQLDLVLYDPNDNIYRPWELTPSTPEANAIECHLSEPDEINNVEQITINSPASGTWTAYVVGAAIPEYPQTYSLAWSYGETGHMGEITTDTIWAAEDSPHVILDNVIVVPDARLTVESGAEVRFLNGKNLVINGALYADNVTFTSNETFPEAGDWWGIKFTSESNNKASSLTNCTIEYSQYGLYLDGTSSILYPITVSGCTISMNTETGIYIKNSSPSISGSTIKNHSNYGICVYGSSSFPTISGSTITQEGGYIGQGSGIYCYEGATITITDNEIDLHNYGIYGYSHYVGPPMLTITGNTVTNNTDSGIYLRAVNTGYYGPVAVINNNSIYANSSYDLRTGAYRDAKTTVLNARNNWWGTVDPVVIASKVYDYSDSTNCPVVHFSDILDGPGGSPITGSYKMGWVTSDATWSVSESPIMIVGKVMVDASATLTIESGVELRFIDSNYFIEVNGRLVADNVTFTSNETFPEAGDWWGIKFTSESNNKASSLTNCTIEYSQYGLYLDGTSSILYPITVSGCTISMNTETGIYIKNSSPSISGSTIKNHSNYGICVYGSSSFPTISGSTITQEGGYIGQGSGIYCYEGATITITDNEIDLHNYGIYGYSHYVGPPMLTITGNTVTNNTDSGIYLRAVNTGYYGPVAVINNNSIYANSSYDLRTGAYRDASATVINAENNWWATVDLNVIAERIYDHSDNSNSPIVDYDPYLYCPTPPDAPASLAYLNLSCNASSAVNWSPVDGTSSYKLQRDTTSSFNDPVTVYEGGETSHTESGLELGSYWYRVLGVNDCGEGIWRTGDHAIVVAPGINPPLDFSYPETDSDGNFTVTWSSVADAVSYTLERDTSSSFDSPVIVYTRQEIFYEEVGLEDGMYWYRVRAINECCDSDWTKGSHSITVSPPCEGDFDIDGDVDGSDLAIFAADFGRTDCVEDCEGDFDHDNDVDGSDLAVFAADFGRTDCP